MLCNLAAGAVEEFAGEHPGRFTWSVTDASTREGVKRLQDLRPRVGRQIPVPGIVVDQEIAFERIPEMDEFAGYLETYL